MGWKKTNGKKKDLVKIIKKNPCCVARVDNNFWVLYKEDPDNNPHKDDDNYDKYDMWEHANTLATSDDDLVIYGDGGYGSGNTYGGDLLGALAAIVGVKIESV